MALQDVLFRELGFTDEDASDVQEKLVEILRDPAIRREAYEFANEEADDLSMLEVHVVIDALISVLKGDEPPWL